MPKRCIIRRQHDAGRRGSGGWKRDAALAGTGGLLWADGAAAPAVRRGRADAADGGAVGPAPHDLRGPGGVSGAGLRHGRIGAVWRLLPAPVGAGAAGHPGGDAAPDHLRGGGRAHPAESAAGAEHGAPGRALGGAVRCVERLCPALLHPPAGGPVHAPDPVEPHGAGGAAALCAVCPGAAPGGYSFGGGGGHPALWPGLHDGGHGLPPDL